MFADTELAARIEASEARLISGTARSVIDTDPHRGAWVREVGGGVASVMGGDSPLNKVAGLGFADLPSAEDLDEIESVFGAQGIPVQVEVSSLADPSLVWMLSQRGYELVGFENVLGRSLSDPVPGSSASEFEIRLVEPESFETWLEVVVRGFSHPDDHGVESHESFPTEVLSNALRDVAGAEGVTQILAVRGDSPVGAASFRMDSGIAQLAGAATLPAHRRRGVQTALLNDRLARAHRAGCEVAVVTTSPGSKSQENVQRRGFSLLYTRAVLVHS